MQLSKQVRGESLGAVVDAIIASNFDSVMVTEGAEKMPVVFINEAFTELTGYTADDMVGQSPALLQGPDTDRAILDRLHADMEADRVFEGETTNYRKDGTPFTMNWRVAPVGGSGGQPDYFVAVQRAKS